MAYFPFFVQMEGMFGLVIGGGEVALRKVQSLLPFGSALTVVAPEACRELWEMPGVVIRNRPFQAEDIEGADFVIAASDDREVNAQAARLCRERRIPVNVADSMEDSSFLFPSLVKRGDLSIGISTGGASPSAAQWCRQEIEGILPGYLEEILADLRERRDWAKEQLTDEESRSQLLRQLFSASLAAGRALTDQEAENLLEGLQRGEEP